MNLISGLSRQWTVFGVAALVAVLALMSSIGSAEAGNVELADAPVPSAVSLDPGTFAHPGLEPGQPAPARFWQDPWLRPGHATPQISFGSIAWGTWACGMTIESGSGFVKCFLDYQSQGW